MIWNGQVLSLEKGNTPTKPKLYFLPKSCTTRPIGKIAKKKSMNRLKSLELDLEAKEAVNESSRPEVLMSLHILGAQPANLAKNESVIRHKFGKFPPIEKRAANGFL